MTIDPSDLSAFKEASMKARKIRYGWFRPLKRPTTADPQQPRSEMAK